MHASKNLFTIIYWSHLWQTLYGCWWVFSHRQHMGFSTKTVHSRMIISWYVILIQAPLLTCSINVLKPNVNVNDWSSYGGRVKLQDLNLIGDRYFLKNHLINIFRIWRNDYVWKIFDQILYRRSASLVWVGSSSRYKLIKH